jgi:hypothetical protein
MSPEEQVALSEERLWRVVFLITRYARNTIRISDQEVRIVKELYRRTQDRDHFSVDELEWQVLRRVTEKLGLTQTPDPFPEWGSPPHPQAVFPDVGSVGPGKPEARVDRDGLSEDRLRLWFGPPEAPGARR